MFAPSPLEDLIPIVAIVCTFVFLMRLARLKHARAQDRDQPTRRELDELKERLEDRDRHIRTLEDRIRVLERIVTDESRKLSSEIERLRA
ncbi:MAG TPA: hypothetical protein VF329_10915 [Gammaproteobacteria bacterium]